MADNFNERDDDDEDDEQGSDYDGPDTLPAFAFTLTGMECLNVECVRSANFIRNKEGTILDIRYALTEHTLNFLSAPFEQFNSDEAYLTLSNDDEKRSTILIMSDLKLTHMELDVDEESDGDMVIHMSFDVASFEQKLNL